MSHTGAPMPDRARCGGSGRPATVVPFVFTATSSSLPVPTLVVILLVCLSTSSSCFLLRIASYDQGQL